MRLCIITYSSAPNPALGMFCFNWDSLSLYTRSLSLSVPDDAHSRGWKWVQTVRSFVRPSFALLLFRAEHLRKGDEVQSKVESWVESWVHPVI